MWTAAAPVQQHVMQNRMKLMTALVCGLAGGLRDPGRLNGAEAEVNGRCTGVMHPVGTDRAEASNMANLAIHVHVCVFALVFVNLN